MSAATQCGPVLVIDDDPTIVDLIDLALSDFGIRCVGATNGRDAISRLEEVHPSLILLDISMPVMDGREFCRWLQSSDRPSIPVVVMTAGHNAARTCDEVGAQAYLVKPFDLMELQTCVQKWAKGA